MIGVGTVVGGYQLTGELGRGGMGVVFTAEHLLLRRPAAVKILRPELSRHQTVVTRFFNEARAASAIRHRGIVEIYDFGFDARGAAYIVMELLTGESLAARLARGQRPLEPWWPVLRSIAIALDAAHRAQIIHRDLKPDNVFLVRDDEVTTGERVKLLDFGVAKLAPHLGAPSTLTGSVLGTPTYMAPEQCRGGAIDHRADLYALGCIACEMAIGRPPFSGASHGDLMAAHLHLPPPDLLELGVPRPAALLIARLLAKDPAARFASAGELVRAIDALPTQRDRIPVASPHAQTHALRLGGVAAPLAEEAVLPPTAPVIARTLVPMSAPVPASLPAATPPSLPLPPPWPALPPPALPPRRLLPSLLAATMVGIVVGAGLWLALGRPVAHRPSQPAAGVKLAPEPRGR